ncbi:hypothetical protein LCGC14_0232810 [marine sediment metagenome]|uniref:Uncharacterized protein n=1 Tax=marine sediment metagenome TaxID=412755 RepID=A0A0F9UAD4_9ZZZZ
MEGIKSSFDPAKFMDSPMFNSYVKFQGLNVYLRKGPVFIDDEQKLVIQLANVKNPRRPNNIAFDPNKRSTGKFKALIGELNELAKIHHYDGIYIESILNEFIPGVLERYGFIEVHLGRGSPNYWRPTQEVT